MSVEIDTKDDREARAHAMKLAELLKSPIVRMQLESEGIRLSGGDGHPVVYQPQRLV